MARVPPPRPPTPGGKSVNVTISLLINVWDPPSKLIAVIAVCVAKKPPTTPNPFTGESLWEVYHVLPPRQAFLQNEIGGNLKEPQPPNAGSKIGQNGGILTRQYLSSGSLFPKIEGHSNTGNMHLEPWTSMHLSYRSPVGSKRISFFQKHVFCKGKVRFEQTLGRGV